MDRLVASHEVEEDLEQMQANQNETKLATTKKAAGEQN